VAMDNSGNAIIAWEQTQSLVSNLWKIEYR